MNDFETLKNEVRVLKGLVESLILSDRYIFQKNLQFMDGRNIQLGVGVGTKIGTAATQKIAFHGATPVVQASAISDASGGATVDTQARAQLVLINAVLHNKGLTA